MIIPNIWENKKYSKPPTRWIVQTIQNLTDQASLPAVCQSRQRIIERTVSRSFTVVVSRWLPSIELKMFIDGKAMTCSTWALNHSWIHVSTLGFKPVALLSTPRVVSDFSMDLDKWFKQVFLCFFFWMAACKKSCGTPVWSHWLPTSWREHCNFCEAVCDNEKHQLVNPN